METFGFSQKADWYAENVRLSHEPGNIGVNYHVSGLMDFEVDLNVPGKFSVYNSLAAIAVSRHFGVPEDVVRDTLKHVAGKGHEDYQEINGIKYPMDEQKLIAEIMKEQPDKR